MSKPIDYFTEVMRDVKLPFPPGHSQTSAMALLQHNIHQHLCRLPDDPSSPFLTTLHSPMRKYPKHKSNVLEEISKMTKSRLPDVLQLLHRNGCRVLFNVQYDPDLRHPEQNILYFRVGEGVLNRRRKDYVKKLFSLMRQPFPKTDIFKTESTLFKYRPETYELQSSMCFNAVEIDNLSGNLTWIKFYLQGCGASSVSLDSMKFFESIVDNKITDEEWCDYLTCRWLMHVSHFYSDTFKLIYEFTDDPVEPDTSECRVSEACAAWWQDAGLQFVKSDLNHLEKARVIVEKMVEEMKTTLSNMIQDSKFEKHTKEEALHKLENMVVISGWPRNFQKLVVRESPILQEEYFDECILKGYKYQYAHILENFNTPVDRHRWRWESCTIVNAFYSREANVVYLPAALFYAPFVFLDKEKDLDTYCAMGSIVAHEMAHAFDYDSRYIDGNGLLKNWWTRKDEEKYMLYVKKIVELYRNRNTLSENMADILGLYLVWNTYLYHRNGETLSKEEMYRFFRVYVISQAQIYMPESERQAEKSDLHALMNVRINVPLSQFKPFQKFISKH